MILPISAASSLTCPIEVWVAPVAGFGSFSFAKPLRDAACMTLGWREAIEGLDRIARDRLTPNMLDRGGMVVMCKRQVLVVRKRIWES